MVKHTLTLLPTNCLSVFGRYVRLALKGLIDPKASLQKSLVHFTHYCTFLYLNLFFASKDFSAFAQ